MIINRLLCCVVFALAVGVHHVTSSYQSQHWPVQQRSDIVNWSPKAQQVDCSSTIAEYGWPPSDYHLVANLSYYKLHEFGTTWNKARRVCEEEGAHLLIVNSQAEADVIKTLMTKHQKIPEALNVNHMWLGLHEKGVHGKFYDLFGEPLESCGYLKWSKTPQQPNDPTPDDCVSFYKSGEMFDDPCHVKYGFICEIDVSAVNHLQHMRSQIDAAPTTFCNGKNCAGAFDASTSSIHWPSINNNDFINWSPKPQLLDCVGNPAERSWPPSDYELCPNLGYYKLHAFGTDWQVARQVCAEEGAHLVIVNSPAESDFLKKLMAKYPKMPDSANKDHVWMGLHERGVHGKFFTIFGDKLEDTGFVNWGSKQPNDPTPDDCATFYNTGVFYDDPCHSKYGFVCEIELSLASSVSAAPHSYQVVNDFVCNDRVCPANDNQGDQSCGQTGGIDVRGSYGGASGGGHEESVPVQQAIAPVSDFYWPPVLTDQAYTAGRWAPQARQVLCASSPEDCTWPPKDYELFTNLGYYKFHPYGTSWYLARQACEEDGAHLIVLNSEKEATVVRSLMTKYPTSVGASKHDHAWVGAHERGVHNDFYTIFGNKLKDTGFWRWCAGEPNDKSLEACVLIKPGGFADWDCDVRFPFVCEIELGQVEARRRMLNTAPQENLA